MEKRNNVISKKIDELINLLLTKGVQPSDIASNIFLNDYSSICYRKIDGMVVGELLIQETDISSSKLRYYYNLTQEVIKIEEEFMGVTSVIWDRNFAESKIVNELVSLLKDVCDERQISRFISTLPKSLQSKVVEEVNKLTA